MNLKQGQTERTVKYGDCMAKTELPSICVREDHHQLKENSAFFAPLKDSKELEVVVLGLRRVLETALPVTADNWFAPNQLIIDCVGHLSQEDYIARGRNELSLNTNHSSIRTFGPVSV